MTGTGTAPLVALVDSSDGFTVAALDEPDVGWDVIDIAGGHDGYVDVRLRYGTHGVVRVDLMRAGRTIGSLAYDADTGTVRTS